MAYIPGIHGAEFRAEGKVPYIAFAYTNHRGEYDIRHARPVILWYGESEYHPGEKHWHLKCHDLDRKADRDFILSHMLRIVEVDPETEQVVS